MDALLPNNKMSSLTTGSKFQVTNRFACLDDGKIHLIGTHASLETLTSLGTHPFCTELERNLAAMGLQPHLLFQWRTHATL